MMASQPRKFSEKIALHNQKQAEGDAAFQQIMREVTDVTSNVSRTILLYALCYFLMYNVQFCFQVFHSDLKEYALVVLLQYDCEVQLCYTI